MNGEIDVSFNTKTDVWVCRMGKSMLASAKIDVWVCKMGETMLPSVQKWMYGFAGWGKLPSTFLMQKPMYVFAGWGKPDDVGHDLHIFSIRIDKARL